MTGADAGPAIRAGRLAALADDDGRFSILAIDHRDSLRQFLAPDDPDSLDASDITALKIELVADVADLASGVMLEPEYSIPQVLDAGALPDGVGFLAALESQGYLDDPEASPTTVLAGWSVEQAEASGAASAKLLLPYRPDGRLADEQERVAVELTEACHAIDFPIALEPLFYGLTDADDRGALVVETARRFAAMGPDLLKLPSPGSAEACAEVTQICVDRGGIPWAMLSGGGSFDDFADQFAMASRAGCSGFMVGRALWGEAVKASPQQRTALVNDQVRPRFERL
ncbi:MAG: 2-deoxy-5-keto-D-gluconate 6-phosphate aldolase domain-containing protein, partial [Ilumatobacter sp.]